GEERRVGRHEPEGTPSTPPPLHRPHQKRPAGGGMSCAHWIGAEHRHCGSTDNVRLYLTGDRCPAHTPRALQGLDEIPPGPGLPAAAWTTPSPLNDRSEEHTSELQSRENLVCRLLLEKKT